MHVQHLVCENVPKNHILRDPVRIHDGTVGRQGKAEGIPEGVPRLRGNRPKNSVDTERKPDCDGDCTGQVLRVQDAEGNGPRNEGTKGSPGESAESWMPRSDI